jgi:hypothetical protein
LKRAVTAAVSSSQREKRGGDCGRKKKVIWRCHVGPDVSEGERDPGVPVREKVSGPRARSPAGLKRFPLAFLFIFLSFFFFLFWFFLFLS